MWKCELNANEQLSNVEFPSEKKNGENLFNREIFFLLPSSLLLIFTIIPFCFCCDRGTTLCEDEKVDVCGVEISKKKRRKNLKFKLLQSCSSSSFLFVTLHSESEEKEIAAAADELLCV